MTTTTTQKIKKWTVDYIVEENVRKVRIMDTWHATGELFTVEVISYPRNQYTVDEMVSDLNERGYFGGSEFRAAFGV